MGLSYHGFACIVNENKNKSKKKGGADGNGNKSNGKNQRVHLDIKTLGFPEDIDGHGHLPHIVNNELLPVKMMAIGRRNAGHGSARQPL